MGPAAYGLPPSGNRDEQDGEILWISIQIILSRSSSRACNTSSYLRIHALSLMSLNGTSLSFLANFSLFQIRLSSLISDLPKIVYAIDLEELI